MSTVGIRKTSSSRSCPKKGWTFILFAILICLAAFVFTHFYKLSRDLRDHRHDQFMGNYKLENQIKILNDNFKKLESAWRGTEARANNQENALRKFENILLQRNSAPEGDLKIRDQKVLEELKTHKNMYTQAQRQIQAYEQQISALLQEMKYYKEQNHLIRQEQAQIRAEYQEIQHRLQQKLETPKEALEQAIEAGLSEFVYADYEHEEKLKDLQKAVESCAKVGELKALEVYYDEKLDTLTNAGPQQSSKAGPNQAEVKQIKEIKQELAKLSVEKEETKLAITKLQEQQKRNEERLNLVKSTGDNISSKLSKNELEAPNSLTDLLETAVKTYNVISQQDIKQIGLKDINNYLKALQLVMNQEPQAQNNYFVEPNLLAQEKPNSLNTTSNQRSQNKSRNISGKPNKINNMAKEQDDLSNEFGDLTALISDLFNDLWWL